MVADAGPEPRTEAEFDYDRTVALSDGVFAIALTLLVLTIAVPDLNGAAQGQLGKHLRGQLPQLYSYGLSFALLGFLWIRHHGMFRTLIRIDWHLSLLNLGYLALVAFLPYPTSLIGRYGSQPVSVIVYSGTLILLTTLSLATRVHSRRARLVAADAPRDSLTRYFVVIGVFSASIPMALFVSASAGTYTWTVLLISGFLSGLQRKPKPAAG